MHRLAHHPPHSNPTRISSDFASSYATAITATDSASTCKASGGCEQDYCECTEEERTAKKLNQITMQFFKKATLTVLSARTQLPKAFNVRGELRQNKWFGLLLDETDAYNEDLLEWTANDLVVNPPPPLCIEIYLDTKDLADGEALTIADEHGKLWDATEALSGSTPMTARPSSRSSRPSRVVLERWTIEVTDNQKMDPDAGRMLPIVYKTGITLFRSLYTYTRLLPAWRYYRHTTKQPATRSSPPLRYRISSGISKSPRRDILDLQLYPAVHSVAQAHQFESVKSPIGLWSIQVRYRNNTDFRVEKLDSVLNSRYMEPMSLPTARNGHPERQCRGGASKNSPTFHQADATETSPVSALHCAKDTDSSESRPRNITPTATGPEPEIPSGHSIPNETTIAPTGLGSRKPSPIYRCRSSFGNRRGKFSVTNSKKARESKNGSRNGSDSSPLLRVGGEISGSVQTDEENILEFLRLLEQNKDLKSLNRIDSAPRMVALSEFQRKRESVEALSNSISSFLRLNCSPSCHFLAVQGMTADTSISTSSSHSKPVPPHAPHMPATPSPLREFSNI